MQELSVSNFPSRKGDRNPGLGVGGFWHTPHLGFWEKTALQATVIIPGSAISKKSQCYSKVRKIAGVHLSSLCGPDICFHFLDDSKKSEWMQMGWDDGS